MDEDNIAAFVFWVGSGSVIAGSAILGSAIQESGAAALIAGGLSLILFTVIKARSP